MFENYIVNSLVVVLPTVTSLIHTDIITTYMRFLCFTAFIISEFEYYFIMGRAKKTKKFATMKRMISASDPRLKDKDRAPPKKIRKEVKTIYFESLSSWLFCAGSPRDKNH